MREWIMAAYGVILLICIVCVILVNRQRPSREQQVMQMIISFISILMTGYFFRIEADTLSELVIAQKIIYLGGCSLYYFMLRFYLLFCRIKLDNRLNAFLILENVVMTVITFTFDRHQLFYRSFRMIKKQGFYILDKEYGPFHMVYIVGVLAYCMAMFAVSVWHTKVSRKNRNKQSWQLIIVALCPTVPYVIEKIYDLSFDIVPFGLAVGVGLMLYLMYFERIYDLQNVARDFVFTSIDAALIVVDSQNRYKGSNALARSIFSELKNVVLNEEIPLISERMNDILKGNSEDLSFEGRVYEMNVRRIEKKGEMIGMVIWLSDVTDQRKYLQFLQNYQNELRVEVDKKTKVLQRVQEQIILGFANIIEDRDHVTGGHVKRTSGYVNIIVKHIKDRARFEEFKDYSYAKHVCQAAPLHDIGKIGIPDVILNKTGKFEPHEFEIMKAHTTIGRKMIDKTLNSLEDREYYELARQMAGCHHERWDGTGYPNGIRGEEIPVCARIMAVADVFDALTSKRPYKEEFPMEKAFRIITEGRGTSFDPDIVDVFLEAREEIVRFHNENYA